MARSQPLLSVTGIAELDKAFDDFAKNTQRKHLRAGAKAAAVLIRDEAKARVPVRTGQLKRSLKTRALPRSRVSVGYGVISAPKGVTLKSGGTAAFHGKAYYGAFVELGTKRTKRQAFLRPAMIANENRAKALFQKAVVNSIKEAARKARIKAAGK